MSGVAPDVGFVGYHAKGPSTGGVARTGSLPASTTYRAAPLCLAPILGVVRLYLVLSTPDGTTLPTQRVELPRLPSVGSTLRPPDVPRACFVTRAVPSSIEETGDIRVAGWIYADTLGAAEI